MKLYKYTPHIDLFLESSSLKLTPIHQLNDPFENKMSIEFITELKEKFSRILPNQIDRFSEFLTNGQSYIGVLSLSVNRFNTTMLSHYAANHSGGILEFTVSNINQGYNNKTDLLKNQNRIKGDFGKVIYLKKRSNPELANARNYIFTENHFEKHKSWSYEKEIRYTSNIIHSDYITIPKEPTILKRLKEIYDENLISYQIKEKEFAAIINQNGKIVKSHPKPFSSILDLTNDPDVQIIKETSHDIQIKIAQQEIFFNPLARLIKRGIEFHPMLEINPEKLTGIYLGSRFETSGFTERHQKNFRNFPNLKSINQLEINPDNFDHYPKLIIKIN